MERILMPLALLMLLILPACGGVVPDDDPSGVWISPWADNDHAAPLVVVNATTDHIACRVDGEWLGIPAGGERYVIEDPCDAVPPDEYLAVQVDGECWSTPACNAKGGCLHTAPLRAWSWGVACSPEGLRR